MKSSCILDDTYLNHRTSDDEGVPINKIYILTDTKFMESVRIKNINFSSQNIPDIEETQPLASKPENDVRIISLNKKLETDLKTTERFTGGLSDRPHLGQLLLNLTGSVRLVEKGMGDNLTRNIDAPLNSKFDSDRVKNFMNYLELSMMQSKKNMTEGLKISIRYISREEIDERNSKRMKELEGKQPPRILKPRTKKYERENKRHASDRPNLGTDRRVHFSNYNTVHVYQR